MLETNITGLTAPERMREIPIARIFLHPRNLQGVKWRLASRLMLWSWNEHHPSMRLGMPMWVSSSVIRSIKANSFNLGKCFCSTYTAVSSGSDQRYAMVDKKSPRGQYCREPAPSLPFASLMRNNLKIDHGLQDYYRWDDMPSVQMWTINVQVRYLCNVCIQDFQRRLRNNPWWWGRLWRWQGGVGKMGKNLRGWQRRLILIRS